MKKKNSKKKNTSLVCVCLNNDLEEKIKSFDDFLVLLEGYIPMSEPDYYIIMNEKSKKVLKKVTYYCDGKISWETF